MVSLSGILSPSRRPSLLNPCLIAFTTSHSSIFFFKLGLTSRHNRKMWRHGAVIATVLAAASSSNQIIAANDSDLQWVDDPRAWHQSLARIVDFRFSTFAEFAEFAPAAKRAGVSTSHRIIRGRRMPQSSVLAHNLVLAHCSGRNLEFVVLQVSALMLVQIQKTAECPGPWYNGLQLCGHINGTFPAADGTLSEWQALVQRLKPMRLMWWINPTSVGVPCLLPRCSTLLSPTHPRLPSCTTSHHFQ